MVGQTQLLTYASYPDHLRLHPNAVLKKGTIEEECGNVQKGEPA